MNTLLNKNMQIESFESLLYPMSVEEFKNAYWGREVLHIERESPDYYNSLMTINDLDLVLDHGRPKGKSLRVVKNQVPISPSNYENEDGSINLNQIYAAYADGHSVIVHEVQRFWQPIQRLCKGLQRECNFRTLGELFLTPKKQKALSPHYDAHDVFVVQLEGSKRWKVYDEVYPTPLVDSFQPIINRDHLQNMREIELKAGDVLFVPRGVPHEAIATDESSMHLSLGIHPFQWLDLINMTMNQIAQTDIDLRLPLPFGFSNECKENQDAKELIKENLIQLISKSVDNVNIDDSLDLLDETFRLRQQPAGDGHFSHLDKIDSITTATKLAHRDFMKVEVKQVASFSRIFFQGNIIKGPAQITPCFEFIANSINGFIVSDIPLLGEEGQLKLARRLIRGGLLKIVTI